MKTIELNTVTQGDCLDLLPCVASRSVDMVLCDLPYGTTSCKWDVIIPFDILWKQYTRILKPNCAIVLTAREPFTSALVMSNIRQYKHKWVWNKKQSGSFQTAKYMPLQIEEDILVFCDGCVRYFPTMRTGKMRKRGGAKKQSGVVGTGFINGYENFSDQYYPTNIIELPNLRIGTVHPTQKPVALFEYLIRTYTNEGDTVLDNCCGSGTTGVACQNTGRNFIQFELSPEYCEIARNRLLLATNKSNCEFSMLPIL